MGMNLQDAVDQLAVALCRPVALDDLDRRPLAAAAGWGGPPPADRAPGSPPFADRQRIAVPVRGDDGPMALLWVATDGLPPLTPADRTALDAAVVHITELLTVAPKDGTTPRDTVVRRLLDPDDGVRRAAFAEGVADRWLDPRGRTTVYAVALDGGLKSVVDRIAFGRHIASARGSGLIYLAERAPGVLMLGRGPRELALAVVRGEAAQHQVVIDGIGTAVVAPGDDDLLASVKSALSAMRIVSLLPSLGGTADASELGPWLMLADVRSDGSGLGRFSPAAEVLVSSPDQLDRDTVEKYLDAGASVRVACELLHIHRTTLYYRLENLPRVVRDALDDGLARSTLHLALKLARLRESSAR
jgi:hypothetical protein